MSDLLSQKIFETLELEAENQPQFRPWLGASVMGHPCPRHLFYSFRWFSRRKFDGRTLRLLRRGKLEEEQVIIDLRRAGLEVSTGNDWSGTHEQWSFGSENGHYGGSIDAAVKGVPGAPDIWHLLEIKTHNRKNFSQLVKHGVRKAHESHWVQCQMYMRWSGLPKTLYFGVCKDDDRLHLEWERFDHVPDTSGAIEEIAQQIVMMNQPPDRLTNKPDYYICKMCDYWEVCHAEGHLGEPERNCRTCISGSATQKGGWHCNKYMSKKSFTEQLAGCREWVPLTEIPF